MDGSIGSHVFTIHKFPSGLASKELELEVYEGRLGQGPQVKPDDTQGKTSQAGPTQGQLAEEFFNVPDLHGKQMQHRKDRQ